MSRFFHLILIFAVLAMISVASAEPATEKAAPNSAAPGDVSPKAADEAAEKAAMKAAAEKAAAEKDAQKAADKPAKSAAAAATEADAAAKKIAAAAPPSVALHPRVQMETTLGTIVIELDGEKAPISTKNFLQYAKDGFYNGTIFHRVIKTFMIQGGGHTIDLTEKTQGLRPGIKNEWRNGLKNKRGTIAMARKGGQADSGTSQFFINVVDNASLDEPNDGSAYAVFGKVVEGMNVVDEIRNTKVVSDPRLPMGPVVPAVPVVIKSVKIITDFDPAGLKPVEEKPDTKLEAAAAKANEEKEMTVEQAIAKIEKETGNPVVKTPSGLMYSIIKEGTGPSPKPTDTVKVHYQGTFLNGKEFDSSYKRREPIEFPLNGVIKGWTEGVGLMKTGGSSYLIIPGDLAYGPKGRPGIPPNATLVFKVELLEIK